MKTIAGVEPGASGSAAFAVRSTRLAADEATVTGTATAPRTARSRG